MKICRSVLLRHIFVSGLFVRKELCYEKSICVPLQLRKVFG